jgi:hypothetical protein
MGCRQTRPQGRAMNAIKGEEFIRQAIRQHVAGPASDVFGGPGAAQAFAFEAKKCDLIEWIDGAQARIEFQAVDDPHLIAEPDMLRSQVPVSVNDVTTAHPAGDHRGSFCQKSRLYAGDLTDEARRQVKARIQQNTPV